MAKLVVLTRERRSENWSQKDYFVVEDSVKDAEQALRKAVREFLFTSKGKKMIDYSGGDFNWGDAIMSVPDELWKKHGLQMKYDNKKYLISGEIIEINVSQDEVLILQEHEDFWEKLNDEV